MLTTAATGGSSVVRVINDWRTASSRTLTDSPSTPSSSNASATGPRCRAHQSSSDSARMSTAITFSIGRTYRRRASVGLLHQPHLVLAADQLPDELGQLAVGLVAATRRAVDQADPPARARRR